MKSEISYRLLTEIKSYLVSDEQKESFKGLVKSFNDIDKTLDKEELYDNTEQFLKEKGCIPYNA